MENSPNNCSFLNQQNYLYYCGKHTHMIDKHFRCIPILLDRQNIYVIAIYTVYIAPLSTIKTIAPQVMYIGNERNTNICIVLCVESGYKQSAEIP